MLLIPSDLDGSYQGLLRAVRSGEIPESRIDESVLKILRAKAAVGLNQATQVDIHAVNQIVAKPASLNAAEEIADEAITLVRDNHQVLPLKATQEGTNAGRNAYQPTAEDRNRTLVLIFTDDSRSDAGRVLEHQMKLRIPEARMMYIDSRNAAVVNPIGNGCGGPGREGDCRGVSKSARRGADQPRGLAECVGGAAGDGLATRSRQNGGDRDGESLHCGYNFPKFVLIFVHSRTRRFRS